MKKRNLFLSLICSIILTVSLVAFTVVTCVSPTSTVDPDPDNTGNVNAPTTSFVVSFYVEGSLYGEEQLIEEGYYAVLPEDPELEGYTFSYWTVSGMQVEVSSYAIKEDTSFVASFSVNSYSVSFTVDGKTVDGSEQTVNYNEVATAPVDPELAGYTFGGWMVDGTIVDVASYKIKGDTTFAAYFTEITSTSHEVTFTVNGNVYSTQNIEEGEYAAAPAAPAIAGYTFDYWTVNGTQVEVSTYAITESTTFEAHYTINTYSVTFTVDGAEVASETVNYNASVTSVPSDPTKTGYTFAGWTVDGTVVDASAYVVTADTEFVADFAINTYTVTFTVDNSVVDTQEVDYNAYAIAPTAPEVAGYTFVGWTVDGTVVDASAYVITADTEFVADFAINSYSVTFTVEGAEVASETVNYNASVTSVPSDPTKTGYTFNGWTVGGVQVSDVSSYVVTADTEFVADFAINTYSVTFTVEGAEVASETVNYNASVTSVPSDPTKTGYTFAGWTVDGTAVDASTYVITADTEFVADFAINSYSVTFTADGAEVASETVNYNASVISVPSDPTKTGFTFAGWTVDGTAVDASAYVITADTEFVAEFAINTYSVTFTANNSVVDTQEVDYNTYATAPAAPAIAGYTFDYWTVGGKQVDVSSYVITEDTEFVASYTIGTYTVIFMSDNDVIDTQKVNYGSSATLPSDPTKTGYTFAGWTTDGNTIVTDYTIVADTTFEAYFEINTYTVKFMANGSVIDTQKVNYGSVAALVTAPDKTGSTFSYWTVNGTRVNVSTYTITANTTFIAKYTTETYTVLFMSGNEVVDTQEVEYGSIATIPTSAPEKTGYTFVGWTTDGSTIVTDYTIVADTTFEAYFEINTYTVKFMADGSVIDTQKVNYGSVATLSTSIPEISGYTFNYWTVNGAEVNISTYKITADTTFVASYVTSVYTVTFMSNDEIVEVEVNGENVESQTVEHGLMVAVVPEIDDQSFAYWTVDGVKVDPSTYAITANTTFVAKYYIYTVTFMSDNEVVQVEIDGVYAESQSVKINSLVTVVPEDPTKTGYTFNYWTVNGEEVEPSTYVITEDTTFVADYTVNTYTATFVDGQNESQYTVDYGTEVTAPEITDYTFVGWTVDGVVVTDFTITADTTFTALYEAGTEEDPYTIASAEEFVSLVNTYGSSSAYFTLANDIDFAEYGNYVTLANSEAFNSTINANGYALKNITIEVTAENVANYINDTQAYVAIFGVLDGATINDLTIDGITITVASEVSSSNSLVIGTLAGEITGGSTIDVTITNATITGDASKNYAGAVAGVVDNATITGSVDATITTLSASEYYLGGVVGYASNATISNMEITLEVNGTYSQNLYIGGVAGYLYNSTVDNVTVNLTVAESGDGMTADEIAAITSIYDDELEASRIGGIASYIKAESDYTTTISNVTVNADINMDVVFGGIFVAIESEGTSTVYVTIENATVKVDGTTLAVYGIGWNANNLKVAGTIVIELNGSVKLTYSVNKVYPVRATTETVIYVNMTDAEVYVTYSYETYSELASADIMAHSTRTSYKSVKYYNESGELVTVK